MMQLCYLVESTISPLEPATQGLDDLLPRLQAAAAAGARFSKWRAPILCNMSSLPTQAGLEAQAESLARFAAISQQAGLVPIVEPDVDFAEDADLKKSVKVHVKIISSLIKPSFPQPGLKHPSVLPRQLRRLAWPQLQSLLVQSLSQHRMSSSSQARPSLFSSPSYLNTLMRSMLLPTRPPLTPLCLSRLPPLTFSFGRGLQGDAMAKWAKGDEAGAKSVFEARAKAYWLAAKREA
ncbi:fructose-bisphosphate aldolase class-I-domain-containing protein [Suillus paluster]|uniref:fructose-bisphosphate aldolase class-I-domain-containing protein n=1 Tax=Suillus paluster TaxID=48578 RepID=UPI001B8858D5|nr:fructose-bisphosphate aldolase class-I-domain-containing protein [Suillus paluster]KAG1745956.1 fructose-bisphosphate aldolase class-I-domain-containing protein [Suillus paluster]